MKYIEKLRKEFNLATGLNDYKSFIKWLEEKEIQIDRYSSVLDYLGLDHKELTIELDRGKYDTIALIDDYPIIEISKYANTIDSNTLLKFKGELFFKEGSKIISNNNSLSYLRLNEEDNYLVYLDDYNKKIFDLIKLNRNIYYGFYGSINDLDIKDKKRYLNEIKEKANYLRYNTANCETEINGTYVNILKIKKKL